MQKLGIDTKLGIAKLKLLFVSILSVGTNIAQALSDGAQFNDVFVVVKEWPNINTIIAQAPGGWQELKDLDPQEATQLTDFIAQEFDIPNDRVEAQIENALRLSTKWYHQTATTVLLFEETKDFVATLKAA